MDIMKIWMSQRNLYRAKQIPAMIEELKDDGELPRIILNRDEDGEIQVQDGHHRLTAIWLSGRTILYKHEYLLVEQNHWRPRCGKIVDLVNKCYGSVR